METPVKNPVNLPVRYAVQIAAYEAELDELHGPDRHSKGWRGRGSYAHKDEETYKRIKYLLKRRDLLTQGKDYPVFLTPGSTPGQWFAHYHLPAPGTQDYESHAPEQLVDPTQMVSALLDPDKRAAIQAILEGK